ncbi:MAG: helix-turn-helix domain-containing protein [Frankia sp.]
MAAEMCGRGVMCREEGVPSRAHGTAEGEGSPMARDDAGLSQLAARITVLRGSTSKSALARQIRYDRTSITRAEQGEIVPSADLLAALDRRWATGGELVARRRKVLGEREVSPTDRREALRGLALGAVAAEISRRIGRADPDALTIDEYEADVYRVAESYFAMPHTRVIERLAPAWRTIEDMLDARVSPAVRRRLTTIAGQYAFYLGKAAFDLGDNDAARRFFALTNHHAVYADDDLLAGSVAAMRASVAYFSGAYPVAADIAQSARRKAHPFNRPILAGSEARAAALAGRTLAAVRALADMQDTVWEGGFLPGAGRGDASLVHAIHATTLTNLGRGDEAEEHARISLRLDKASDPDQFVRISGDWKCIGQSFLRRPLPDADGAADALGNALSMLDGRGQDRGVQEITQLWREMDARWPGVQSIGRLGDSLAAVSARP